MKKGMLCFSKNRIDFVVSKEKLLEYFQPNKHFYFQDIILDNLEVSRIYNKSYYNGEKNKETNKGKIIIETELIQFCVNDNKYAIMFRYPDFPARVSFSDTFFSYGTTYIIKNGKWGKMGQ